jgi:hypothetical protein
VHHYLADESNPEAERNLTLIPLTSEIEIKKKKREGGAWRSVQELPENPVGK